LFAYEAIWRVLMFLMIGPLSIMVLNALVQQSGRPAITNLGLLSFVLSPLGLATLVLSVTFGLTMSALETAGLVLILMRAARGLKVSSLQALRVTSARLPALVTASLAQVVLGLLAMLPFLGVAALLWWLLLSGSDINYYLARRPPKFLIAVSAGAVLGLGMLLVLILLYLRWLFVVPICLFEGKMAFGALHASAALGRGERIHLLVWFGAWQLLRLAVGAAVLFGLEHLNRALLGADTENGSLIVRTVCCLALDGAILLLVSMLDGIGFALLLAVYFEKLHRRQGKALAESLLSDGPPPRPTSRVLRFTAWGGLGVLGASVLGESVLLADQFAARRPVGVTAHRAGPHQGPENTLLALRQAIADGADYAEIDVQETADGVVVVLHDKDLRRLTGDPRNIWDVTFDEVRRLDVGQGERIASLEEFIEASRGQIKLNIELKYNGREQQLEERVVALLHKHDFLSQVVITSMEYRGLQEVRRIEPKLRTGYIVSASLGNLSQMDVDFLSVRDALVTPALRRQTHDRDWELHVWTVNDRKKIEAMLDRDVDNLITDNVLLAREVLRERESLPDVELILNRLHVWMRSGRELQRAR
jgi:glycerophosphoryl diester phosphodiesterase